MPFHILNGPLSGVPWSCTTGLVALFVAVLLSGPAEAQAPSTEGWAAWRGAGPGAWSLGLGLAGNNGGETSPDAKPTGWCAMIRAGSGQDFRTSLEVGVILQPDWRGILGWQWDRGAAGSMVVGWGGPRILGRLVLPLAQPAARPYRPTMALGTRFEAWQGASGRAVVTWSAGGFPRILATVCEPPWTWSVGSTGAWLSWSPRTTEGPGLRCAVGLLRSSIPWAGLDWGRTGWIGSDPGEWPFQQWLE